MTNDGDSLAALAAAKFLSGRHFTIRPVVPGLSGGSVFRCTTADGEFALKRWPASTSKQRVDDIHAVQRHAQTTLDLVPQVFSCNGIGHRLSIDQTHFDLTSWMPGSPLSGHDLHLERSVSVGAAAIARFHLATENLGTAQAVAPALIRRQHRLTELQTLLPTAIAIARAESGIIRTAGDFLSAHWRRIQGESVANLLSWGSTRVPIQWVLCDVHRDHVLFVDDHVSGIVDFDAVKRDTVACDLARWVGSFADLGINVDLLWKAAIAGYTTERAISPCEREMASAIEKVSWYIHFANWVVWATGVPQNIPGGIEAAHRRIADLLRRSDVVG